MKIRKLILIFLLQLVVVINCFAQQPPDSLMAIPSKISQKYLNTVTERSGKATEAIDKQTEKYLAKLEKQEADMKKKLSKIDSVAAKNIFTDAEKQYTDLENKVKTKSESLLHKGSQYFPWLDSASTSLKFLESKNPVTGAIGTNSAKITGALSKVKELENQFKQAASVKDFIRQRKEYLKEQLQNYNFGSELKNYNQTAYYYSQQLNEYRQALNDPDKAQTKVMAALNKLPAYQNFMKKNSMLSSLFAVPGGNTAAPDGNIPNPQGLQTKASVEKLVQGKLATGGPGAKDMLQQNIADAQSVLTQLKSRLTQYGGSGGSDMDMPEYQPNNQKTKTFLKRLQYSFSFQSTKSNYYFPTTSDVAVGLGYKINDKNILGIGLSYKIGWGQDIKHIAVSSQGIGLRSFADFKLKGSLYISGGFEYNYQQPFSSVHPLYNISNWQQSGLLGVSKIVSLKTKILKQTKLQLLWDMLSYYQVPQTQPIKFRVGYSF